MISKIYTKDWFGRTERDYIYDPSDAMHGIVQIPNHKYSSFLYNEDKAERICSDLDLLKREITDMVHAIGLSNIGINLSEDNETAMTNGSFIEIGVGKEYKSAADCYEKLDRIIGLAIHESCHCLYTDFSYVHRVIYKYPSLVHHIHNIIEDEIIEGKLCLSYPGYHNFLNKLKYNVFENNKNEDEPMEHEIGEVLEILFYLIRYPKFISTIDEEILAKHENIIAEIKKIMKDNGCFNYKNPNPTRSSTDAAVQIYELLMDRLVKNNGNDKDDNSENGKGNDNKNKKENNESSNNGSSNNESDNDGDSDITVHVLDENDPIFNQIANGEGIGIIAIMSSILEEISSISEQTTVKDLTVYHKKIEESIQNMVDFNWKKCEGSVNTNDIKEWTNEDVTNYNTYKREVSYYINKVKKLIISNSKKTIITNSRFNRNGTLDPTRLANAMCNEQTVYIRKESKQIDNEPEYALAIVLDESGSMTDHGINLLASKIAIMIYEAMINYPKIKLFVYGHGDVVYKYIDIKNCRNKYVLGDRRQQGGQNELKSYKIITDDIKSQTKLPIVMFNITDSCYCSNERKLAALVEELRNDPKQKTFINLICLGHNNETNTSVTTWNDLIYGKGNWVIYDRNRFSIEWENTIKKIGEIIHRTIKLR